MPDDDLRTGSAPIRGQRDAGERDESTRMSPDEAKDRDEIRPDAVSPQERRDTEAPVRGGMTAEDGQGAAGGRDRGGPGGQQRGTADDVAGRGVHADPND